MKIVYHDFGQKTSLKLPAGFGSAILVPPVGLAVASMPKISN